MQNPKQGTLSQAQWAYLVAVSLAAMVLGWVFSFSLIPPDVHPVAAGILAAAGLIDLYAQVGWVRGTKAHYYWAVRAVLLIAMTTTFGDHPCPAAATSFPGVAAAFYAPTTKSLKMRIFLTTLGVALFCVGGYLGTNNVTWTQLLAVLR